MSGTNMSMSVAVDTRFLLHKSVSESSQVAATFASSHGVVSVDSDVTSWSTKTQGCYTLRLHARVSVLQLIRNLD